MRTDLGDWLDPVAEQRGRWVTLWTQKIGRFALVSFFLTPDECRVLAAELKAAADLAERGKA